MISADYTYTTPEKRTLVFKHSSMCRSERTVYTVCAHTRSSFVRCQPDVTACGGPRCFSATSPEFWKHLRMDVQMGWCPACSAYYAANSVTSNRLVSNYWDTERGVLNYWAIKAMNGWRRPTLPGSVPAEELDTDSRFVVAGAAKVGAGFGEPRAEEASLVYAVCNGADLVSNPLPEHLPAHMISEVPASIKKGKKKAGRWAGGTTYILPPLNIVGFVRDLRTATLEWAVENERRMDPRPPLQGLRHGSDHLYGNMERDTDGATRLWPDVAPCPGSVQMRLRELGNCRSMSQLAFLGYRTKGNGSSVPNDGMTATQTYIAIYHDPVPRAFRVPDGDLEHPRPRVPRLAENTRSVRFHRDVVPSVAGHLTEVLEVPLSESPSPVPWSRPAWPGDLPSPSDSPSMFDNGPLNRRQKITTRRIPSRNAFAPHHDNPPSQHVHRRQERKHHQRQRQQDSPSPAWPPQNFVPFRPGQQASCVPSLDTSSEAVALRHTLSNYSLALHGQSACTRSSDHAGATSATRPPTPVIVDSISPRDSVSSISSSFLDSFEPSLQMLESLVFGSGSAAGIADTGNGDDTSENGVHQPPSATREDLEAPGVVVPLQSEIVSSGNTSFVDWADSSSSWVSLPTSSLDVGAASNRNSTGSSVPWHHVRHDTGPVSPRSLPQKAWGSPSTSSPQYQAAVQEDAMLPATTYRRPLSPLPATTPSQTPHTNATHTQVGSPRSAVPGCADCTRISLEELSAPPRRARSLVTTGVGAGVGIYSLDEREDAQVAVQAACFCRPGSATPDGVAVMCDPCSARLRAAAKGTMFI